MNSTAKRLYLVAIMVVAAYGIGRLVQAEVEPPEAVMPNWTFREMPYQIDNWHGEDTKIDPDIAVATGADVIVDRAYRDEQGHSVSLHTAVFKDPADGVHHAPENCYRGAGWTKESAERKEVQVLGGEKIPVVVTTWSKEGESVMVLYWYQLGDHVLFDRWQLGELRWSLRRQTKWPALIKVMLQISANSRDDALPILLGFAELVAKWENQPKHREYFEKFQKE
jgi:EpsI family protein